MSYRTKLQTAFLLFGLTALALTDWEASTGATRALEQATYDRLTAIRQTRVRQIERWFADLGKHVLALAADESTVAAVELFHKVWERMASVSQHDHDALIRHYRDVFTPTVRSHMGGPEQAAAWLPKDPRSRALQSIFIAGNPHPVGHKDRMLAAPGAYGEIHARYHPTLHRYQTAFGLYDIFLIDAEGCVVYTVFKEIDLGVCLNESPYRESALGRIYRRVLTLDEPEQFLTSDYAVYLPSHLAPAAFLATPIWRAGERSGVLAIQVSPEEVNRVMSNDGRWREEGLGETGQAYIVGSDGLLRSEYFAPRDGSAILKKAVPAEVATLHSLPSGTGTGEDSKGVRVLRSHARMNVEGLNWSVVAEISEEEALLPVRHLRTRILGIGAVIAAVFFGAATWLARSVTRPVTELAEGAHRLGRRDFGVRLPVRSQDEIGDLAASFNRMADDLERTTVSKVELEQLAGRLITVQEDERRRLASELHDGLSQRLAALAIEAGIMQQSDDSLQMRRAASRIKEQMALLSAEIHGMARNLHPAMLDDLGLAAAIESEGRALFERGGPSVEVTISHDFPKLPAAQELALFRIVQESLRNAEKHAAASVIQVRLNHGDRETHLLIEDDGRGFDRTRPQWKAGIGLASMEERARSLGGRFKVDSRPDDGTRIEVWIPIDPAPDQT